MTDFIRITILVLFVLTLIGFILQRKILYYPSTDLPSPASLAADNLQFWPSAFEDYRGLVSIAEADTIKGTIIVFHGNAGTAADRAYYVNPLTKLGYRVLLAEYPGYGGRKGNPGEETFVRDAQETMRLASEKYGNPIYVLGESLGSGVAAAAVKDSPVKIHGIILITPWDTLLSVARETVPWLPVRLLMRDTYDTVGNLKDYQGRIAIIGAERDTVIPIHHALDLYQSLQGRQGSRKMYTIKGAEHNDWQGMVGSAWWKEITDHMHD